MSNRLRFIIFVAVVVILPLYYFGMKELIKSHCDLLIGPTVEKCYQNLGGLAGFAHNYTTPFYFLATVVFLMLLAVIYLIGKRIVK